MPPPPPKKRRPWLIALISAGVVLVLCCGLGLGRLFFRLKHVSDIDKDVNKATAAFIEDRRDGLSQAGYDALCTQAKGDFRLQDLAAPQKDASVGFRILDTSVDYDRRRALVTVEERQADGSTDQQTYIVNEEGERWLMCEFPR
jgi:hypothetical protein